MICLLQLYKIKNYQKIDNISRFREFYLRNKYRRNANIF